MRDSVSKVMLLGLAVAVAASAAEPPLSKVFGDRRFIPVQTAAGPGALTVSMLDGSKTGLYYDLGERAGVLRPKAKKVVLLGMGGGEMLRAARRSLPKADLLGIDNDPRMLKAAVQEFHVERFGARTQLADAFLEVKKLRAVDVLMVDLFVGDTMPPASLNAAFWRDCQAAIGTNGLVLVNVYPAHLVLGVEALMAAAGLEVIERHTPLGTGGVLIADQKLLHTGIEVRSSTSRELARCKPDGRCFLPDGGEL
jgi:spermidine synthase